MLMLIAVPRDILKTLKDEHKEPFPADEPKFRILHLFFEKHKQRNGILIRYNTPVNEHKAFLHHFIPNSTSKIHLLKYGGLLSF
jgi:hypothetical protein